MRSMTVEVDGPVHVADFGGAGPPIVLIHGLGGSHVNWFAVADALTRHGRVLAPDLVGFGRTPPEGRSSSCLDSRDFLQRFLEQEVGEPAVLVGNSMGGLLAMLVAARAPELVAGLVPVAPALPRPPGSVPDPSVAGYFALYMLPWVAERAIRLRYAMLQPEGVVRQTFQLCTADPSRIPPEVYDAHVAFARERAEMVWSHSCFTSAARSLVGFLARRGRVERAVGQIQAPGLIVAGAADRLVSTASVQRLAEVRPDWTLSVFEGVGHLPMLEAPDKFVEVVGRWLGGLGAGRATA